MTRFSRQAVTVAVYLGLSIWGAVGLPGLRGTGSLGTTVLSIGELTGCTNQYGFYAPRVGSPIRIRVSIQESAGTTTLVLGDQLTSEGALRTHSISSEFRNDPPAAFRRQLAASIADAMLRQYPQALAITVEVEALLIPRLRSNDAEAACHWQLIYRACFSPGAQHEDAMASTNSGTGEL